MDTKPTQSYFRIVTAESVNVGEWVGFEPELDGEYEYEVISKSVTPGGFVIALDNGSGVIELRLLPTSHFYTHNPEYSYPDPEHE